MVKEIDKETLMAELDDDDDEDDEDEVDNSFIKIVSRNHPMFKNRSMSFTYVKDGNIITEKLPTIPVETIVCDGCNSVIKDDFVGLLMLAPNHCWGTQCKSCVKKYYSDLPVIGKRLT